MVGKYLIVGLGNIGSEYLNTRHNVGFMVLDHLIEGTSTIFSNVRYAAKGEMTYKGRELILIKPSTYMNLSGKAVAYWANRENIPIENILIICDDIALPFGTLRMRKQGSDGGHNGLANIGQLLQTFKFSRLRVGVGNDFALGGQINYVLGTFEPEQIAQIKPILERASQAIKDFVFIGPERAMNICNTTPPKGITDENPTENSKEASNEKSDNSLEIAH